MKKTLLFLFAGVFFLLSGFSVYSYFYKKDPYWGETVVPGRREDLPLYKGLTFMEHPYVMKGNHWYIIYEFYKNELPQNGWMLVNKNVSLESNGGFMMDWEKNEKIFLFMAAGTALKIKQKLCLILILFFTILCGLNKKNLGPHVMDQGYCFYACCCDDSKRGSYIIMA